MYIAYIIIAATALAFISVFYKLIGNSLPTPLVLTIIYSFLAVSGVVYNLALGVDPAQSLQSKDKLLWLWIVLAGLSVFASDFFSLKGFGLGLPVWMANLISIGVLTTLSTFLGFVLFKESINSAQILGFCFVLIGLVLITVNQHR